MILFLKKSRNTMLASAAVLFLIVLVWRYGQGRNIALQTGFKPVNEQMQQLIDQGKEQAPVRSNSDKTLNTPGASKSESKPTSTPIASKSESEQAAIPDASKSRSKPAASPKASKSTSPSSAPSSIPKTAAKTTDKIDLNSATLEQLDALPGIGESKAKAILAYRKEKGSFTKIEQLLEIKGISEKMLAALKSSIYIGPR
ncbi:helix-hairpin-helix domain-containing protein [Paenibacillus sp. GP183]|uniref:ComEA family DNA-binding protein n=1 Tax=Paenibacillus sp. GP183 TaxID=1882751 RepID=UPI00089B52D1|nr:helix-hairpin-helix domain-containing protein [Paenibacillus sp. GP183]SEB40488.1 competence protein ComEA helix-hairpin-helix repeat region [Paenibacillus sp. GP183]